MPVPPPVMPMRIVCNVIDGQYPVTVDADTIEKAQQLFDLLKESRIVTELTMYDAQCRGFRTAIGAGNPLNECGCPRPRTITLAVGQSIGA